MKISKELLKGSTGIMVLGVLAEDDLYGYAIIREIEERSGSLFRMSEGSLYPILHSMEKDGLLESYRKVSEIGKERKYYRITAKGSLQLKLRLEEWSAFTEGVSVVLFP
jgi:DNA-binding PadR family transcriptional regulator